MKNKREEEIELAKQLTRMDSVSMALIISAALLTRKDSKILKGVSKLLDDNINKQMSEKENAEYKQLDLF